MRPAPQIRRAGQGGFREWYDSLPPVTKYHATACIICTAAVSLGVLDVTWIYFDWSKVFKLQVWRIITNFMLIGKFGPRFFFRLLWLVMYGVRLEQSNHFLNNTAEYVWMYFIGIATIMVLSLLPIFQSYFYATPLIYMVLYVWSRYNATAPVSIMGLVTIQGFYLPFAFMAVGMIGEQGYWPMGALQDVLGILAGHLYYFLKEIEPRRSGRDLLKVPRIVHRWVAQSGLGPVPPAAVPREHPSDMGFRAFQGRGRRVGD